MGGDRDVSFEGDSECRKREIVRVYVCVRMCVCEHVRMYVCVCACGEDVVDSDSERRKRVIACM